MLRKAKRCILFGSSLQNSSSGYFSPLPVKPEVDVMINRESNLIYLPCHLREFYYDKREQFSR